MWRSSIVNLWSLTFSTSDSMVTSQWMKTRHPSLLANWFAQIISNISNNFCPVLYKHSCNTLSNAMSSTGDNSYLTFQSRKNWSHIIMQLICKNIRIWSTSYLYYENNKVYLVCVLWDRKRPLMLLLKSSLLAQFIMVRCEFVPCSIVSPMQPSLKTCDWQRY